MATIVTKSNLFSEARNNIVDIISTNVQDPTTSSSQFRKWIYSREPDVKSNGFKGFPIIIIYPTEFDMSTEGKSLNMKSHFVEWTMEIEVVASDRGVGNKNGKGLEYVDSVSNSIAEVLNNVTNRNTLRGNLIHNVSFSAGGVSSDALADELVYRRSFILNISTRLATSS